LKLFSTAGFCQFDTQQTLVIGMTAGQILDLDSDTINFRASNGAQRGYWISTELGIQTKALLYEVAPPAGTPTLSGYLYVGDGTGGSTAGTLYYKGPSGTVTPIAVA